MSLSTCHDAIAVALMMDWTDRHCRYFMRLLSPSAVLYTEMVTAAAIHVAVSDVLFWRVIEPSSLINLTI